jgi:hypothetical protein
MTAWTVLAQKMRDAADALAEANIVYGFSPEYGVWSPTALRHEASIVESEVDDEHL